jgi:hypothetical protein
MGRNELREAAVSCRKCTFEAQYLHRYLQSFDLIAGILLVWENMVA